MPSEIACCADEAEDASDDDASSDDTEELDDRYESLWQVPEEVQVCAFALLLSHAFSGGFVFAAHLVIIPRYFHLYPKLV